MYRRVLYIFFYIHTLVTALPFLGQYYFIRLLIVLRRFNNELMAIRIIYYILL